MKKKYNTGSADARALVALVRGGDGEAFERLLELYEPMIGAALYRYVPEGAEPEDARQEALAGFYRATLTFDLGQPDVAFGLYAKICVTNALISHAREIMRRVRGSAVNLEYDDYMRYCADAQADPAERVVERESTEELRRLIRENLSPYENRVWDMYTAGMPTGAIAERLSKTPRSIDNALYRIRRKLRSLLEINGHQS
ncbi:MAG: sigma-70 family RNA polymerase sigma factor [Clostridia bacterium]|nr:sigma-70 family RNA polymerase sigma factor [Clostridia bacterium]